MTALVSRFSIAGDLSIFAGEAPPVELAFQGKDGALIDLTGRVFALTIYRIKDREVLYSAAGNIIVQAADKFVRFAIDGDTTEILYQTERINCRYEIAELTALGREVWIEGKIAIAKSAAVANPGVVAVGDGSVTRFVFDNQTHRLTISSRGDPGRAASDQLFVAGIIPAPTTPAMAAWQRKPAEDAADRAGEDVGAAIAELGEFTSQRSADIDDAIDKADADVEAFTTVARADVDAKLLAADQKIEATETARAATIAATKNADDTRAATEQTRQTAQAVVDAGASIVATEPRVVAARDQALSSAQHAARVFGYGFRALRLTATPTVLPLAIDDAGIIAAGIDRVTGALIARFDGKQALFRTAMNVALAAATGGIRYRGTGATLPLLLDQAGTVVVGTDRSTGALIARFDGRQALWRAALGVGMNALAGGYRYRGTASIQPMLIDTAGTILLGHRVSTGAIIARFDATEPTFAKPVKRAIAPELQGLLRYTGTGSVRPLSLMGDGTVALGWDEQALAPAGALVSPVPRTPARALAEVDRVPLGSSTILGVLSYGQSLSVGADGGAVVSTVQRFGNVKLDTGLRYGPGSPTAFVPLVETLVGRDGETPCTAAADAIVELAVRDSRRSPSDVVIFGAAPGQGSQTLAALSKGASTDYYWRLRNYVIAARDLAAAAGKTFAVPVIMWVQGEADLDAGTTRADYIAGMRKLRSDLDADIKAITGQTCPVRIVLYQTVHNSAANSGTKAIQKAQFDLARSEPHFFMGGPIYHLYGSSGGTGQIHMSSLGYALMGRQLGRAAKQLIVDNAHAQWLEPLSALAEGQTIRLRFAVPQMPLVIDRVNMRACKDNGIAVADDAGVRAITGMVVEAGDTLAITFGGGALGANPVVRGALDYGATGTPFINGSGTNLRDSTRDTVLIAGTRYPLWHRCPHFELPVTVLS